MKFKELICDSSGSTGSFVWTVIVFTFLTVMLVWTSLYEAIKAMMDYATETNNALPVAQQDPLLVYMILIIDLFPIWVLIGLTILGISAAQKRDESDY